MVSPFPGVEIAAACLRLSLRYINTVEISDSLRHEVRRPTAREGVTFRTLVERALHHVISEKKHRAPFKLRRGTARVARLAENWPSQSSKSGHLNCHAVMHGRRRAQSMPSRSRWDFELPATGTMRCR